MRAIATLTFLALTVFAAPAQAADCQSITDKTKRLACYDKAAAAAKANPPECKTFEEKSNLLLDRMTVGFQNPEPLQAMVGELLHSFQTCKASGPPEARQNAYSKTMQAWLLAANAYVDGVRRCSDSNRSAASAGLNMTTCTEWTRAMLLDGQREMLAKEHPGFDLSKAVSWGGIFAVAMKQVTRFE